MTVFYYMFMSVGLCISYDILNSIYYLQSLFISMKICVVVMALLRSLIVVPAKSVL